MAFSQLWDSVMGTRDKMFKVFNTIYPKETTMPRRHKVCMLCGKPLRNHYIMPISDYGIIRFCVSCGRSFRLHTLASKTVQFKDSKTGITWVFPTNLSLFYRMGFNITNVNTISTFSNDTRITSILEEDRLLCTGWNPNFYGVKVSRLTNRLLNYSYTPWITAMSRENLLKNDRLEVFKNIAYIADPAYTGSLKFYRQHQLYECVSAWVQRMSIFSLDRSVSLDAIPWEDIPMGVFEIFARYMEGGWAKSIKYPDVERLRHYREMGSIFISVGRGISHLAQNTFDTVSGRMPPNVECAKINIDTAISANVPVPIFSIKGLGFLSALGVDNSVNRAYSGDSTYPLLNPDAPPHAFTVFHNAEERGGMPYVLAPNEMPVVFSEQLLNFGLRRSPAIPVLALQHCAVCGSIHPLQVTSGMANHIGAPVTFHRIGGFRCSTGMVVEKDVVAFHVGRRERKTIRVRTYTGICSNCGDYSNGTDKLKFCIRCGQLFYKAAERLTGLQAAGLTVSSDDGGPNVCAYCSDAIERCDICHQKAFSVINTPEIHTSIDRKNNINITDVSKIKKICQTCYSAYFAICSCENKRIPTVKTGKSVRTCENCKTDGKTPLQFLQHLGFNGTSCLVNYSFKPAPWFHKAPTTVEKTPLYFGIEHEVHCLGPGVPVSFATASKVSDGRLSEGFNAAMDYFYGKFDASMAFVKLDGSVHNGMEIVFQPMDFDTIHHVNWKTFTDEISSIPSRYCGLHVHTNREKFTANQLWRIMHFYNTHDAFVSYLSRRKRGEYNRGFFGNVAAKVKGSLRTSRYEAVNVTNKHTIEFRNFAGAWKPQHFLEAVEFLDALFYWTQNLSNKEAGNFLSFAKYVKDHKKRYSFLFDVLVLFSESKGGLG